MNEQRVATVGFLLFALLLLLAAVYATQAFR